MALTITEALAEIKTIDKRLEKKREAVAGNLARPERLKDPLEKQGGSVNFVKAERQSIRDLEERKVAIRRAINQANQNKTVVIGDQSRSVADWLVWRREVSPNLQRFLVTVRTRLDAVRRDAQNKGANLVAQGEAKTDNDIIVHVNEKELAAEIEAIETILGTLDGKLSLHNATVTIDV